MCHSKQSLMNKLLTLFRRNLSMKCSCRHTLLMVIQFQFAIRFMHIKQKSTFVHTFSFKRSSIKNLYLLFDDHSMSYISYLVSSDEYIRYRDKPSVFFLYTRMMKDWSEIYFAVVFLSI